MTALPWKAPLRLMILRFTGFAAGNVVKPGELTHRVIRLRTKPDKNTLLPGIGEVRQTCPVTS